MLTVADASAVLLVCLGVGVLVLLCCAALIWARTQFAPHADCKKELSAFAGLLEEITLRQKTLIKRKSGEVGGRPSKTIEVRTEATVVPGEATAGRLSDEDLEKAAGSRMLQMINGRSS